MLKKLHRTLLVLVLVMIPPYFLIFTDEGRRIADTTLLWLISGDSIEFNLRELDRSVSKDDILQVFADQDWQCGEQASPFGSEVCVAKISAYNGYPARYMSIFFQQNNVSALKMVYRKLYHEQILAHLLEQLGKPSKVEGQAVVEWDAPGVKVVMPKELLAGAEPAFMWLAR